MAHSGPSGTLEKHVGGKPRPAREAAKKGKVSWNFEKFVVGKNGAVVARFAPGTEPDAPDVVSVIESELKK